MNLFVFNLNTTADGDTDKSVLFVLREFVKNAIESELKIKTLYSNHAVCIEENEFSNITFSTYDMIRKCMENVSVGLFLSGCVSYVEAAHVYYNPSEKKGVIKLIKNRGSNHNLLETIAEIDEHSDEVKRRHFFGTIKNMNGLSDSIYEEVNGYLKELRSECKEKIAQLPVEERLEALEEAVLSLGEKFVNMATTIDLILKGE